MDETESSELPIDEASSTAAAQEDMEGVATGAGAVAAGGSIDGTTIASGKGAVAFDGANEGQINTGSSASEPPPVVETVVIEAPVASPEPVADVSEPDPAPPPPEPGKLEEARVVVEEAFEQLFSDEAEAVRYLEDPPAWLAFGAVDPEVAVTLEFGQIVLEIAKDMTAPPPDPSPAPGPPLRPAGPDVSSIVPPSASPSPESEPLPGEPPPEIQTPAEPPGTAEVPPLIVVEEVVTRHVVEVFEDSPEVSGIMADGSTDGAVVGDGNTVNNVFDAGPEPGPTHFGAGDSSDADSSALDEPLLDESSLGFGEGAEGGHREALDTDPDATAHDVLPDHAQLEQDGSVHEAELVFEEPVDEPVLPPEDIEVDAMAAESDGGDDLLDE